MKGKHPPSQDHPSGMLITDADDSSIGGGGSTGAGRKEHGIGGQPWDNNVQRHSIAMGYHINRYLLIRVAASTQQVKNKNWDKTQRTFRLVLTAHY